MRSEIWNSWSPVPNNGSRSCCIFKLVTTLGINKQENKTNKPTANPMHAYFFNARARTHQKNKFPEGRSKWHWRCPSWFSLLLRFWKQVSDFPVYLSQGWLAFWTDLCRQKTNVFQILPMQENERPLKPAEKGVPDFKTAGPTLGYHFWVREFMFGICSCHMCPCFAGEHVACALTWLVQPLDPTDRKRYTPDVLE